MKSLKTFLTERVSVEKVLHLQHIEDLIIQKGRDGLRQITELFNSIIDQLSGMKGSKLELKIKVDGSPSLFCGINPENKQFFVGTKSIFNKLDPKINYTNEDIDKNHDKPGLNHKLKIALKYLQELGITKIIQGDMLYTQDDLNTKEIDGKKYITFRPNTITYAIPQGSQLAKDIVIAKMGIVFHTQYSGSSMANLKASLKVDISKLKDSTDVWYKEADFEKVSDKVKVTDADVKLFKDDLKELDNISNRMDKSFLDKIEDDIDLVTLLMSYNNFLVRKGQINKSAKDKYVQLIEYIKDKFSGEISLRKTETGKLRRGKKMDYIIKIFEDNKDDVVALFELQNIMIKLKLEILNKMNQLRTIETFVDEDGKLIPTSQEGFVAITDSGAVKLIDRDVYSRLNFNLPKDWK